MEYGMTIISEFVVFYILFFNIILKSYPYP